MNIQNNGINPLGVTFQNQIGAMPLVPQHFWGVVSPNGINNYNFGVPNQFGGMAYTPAPIMQPQISMGISQVFPQTSSIVPNITNSKIEYIKSISSASREYQNFTLYITSQGIFIILKKLFNIIALLHKCLIYNFQIYDNNIIYLPLTIYSNSQPTKEHIINHATSIGTNYFFLSLKSSDFLSTDNGIIFIGFDNIVPKIFCEDIEVPLLSVFNERVFQDPKMCLDNDSNLFFSSGVVFKKDEIKDLELFKNLANR